MHSKPSRMEKVLIENTYLVVAYKLDGFLSFISLSVPLA